MMVAVMKLPPLLAIAAAVVITALFTSQTAAPSSSKQAGASKYQIVEADSTDSLEENVTQFLRQGWKPQGGVEVVFQSVNASPRVRLFQAMTK